MTDNESAGMERLDTASFVVRGWMFSPTGLALSGNELLVYARIYGAVQRDNGLWVMPGRRLAVELGISANTACRCLNEFVRRGLI